AGTSLSLVRQADRHHLRPRVRAERGPSALAPALRREPDPRLPAMEGGYGPRRPLDEADRGARSRRDLWLHDRECPLDPARLAVANRPLDSEPVDQLAAVRAVELLERLGPGDLVDQR